jgi:nitroimidazol reductase NimA-like FMN-containing flavoprotein (pyridoxamine 5'-phosphate oxidase superfamily)
VAFAYEAENERAVLDLGFAPESKKRGFIEATDEVCLTTYEWSEPYDWKSVVMSGPFKELGDGEVDDDRLRGSVASTVLRTIGVPVSVATRPATGSGRTRRVSSMGARSRRMA